MSNQIKHRKLGTEPLAGLYYVSECIKCGWVGSSGELSEDAQCLQPVGDDHCWGDTDEIEADRLLGLVQAGEFNKPVTHPIPDPVLCKFYDANDWPELVRELVDHVAQLQDSAKRNVKPWEDAFPATLLPAYIERVNVANAGSQLQGDPVYMVRSHGSCCWEEMKGECLEVCQAQPAEYEVRRLYAEQPAPAPAPPRGLLHHAEKVDGREWGPAVKRLLRRKIEAWLILLAAKILINRNVQRSAVVSRRDNNAMWAIAEQLEAIAKRISKKYP
nr:hypothetical protein [Pseudomonas fragi]